ncbi:hypothetical protein PTSG_08863 [Salpingoeca rosetta]|uniref:Purple acid phosphatase n=1 Tax=Salpingoeca rosetta (strain ATCC 50818 / BSB-021) TaxID=946362 RepID=F2UKX4_SALR5|nr:uncharacterized protein PTSG_08863 [Salpingoeca rosetta]EGD77773.1 hypothetical protein PTSG_08863 [Salpingoeca rosetta]|eukprot:XP_004990249.1 hypothetical protein PTSG_08863 [Salpingoeca rosetta]
MLSCGVVARAVAACCAALLVAAVCSAPGVSAHSGRGELFELLDRVDLNADKVISSEEVALWAAANGATTAAGTNHSFTQEHVLALSKLLSSPILDGTVPVEVHTSLLNNSRLAIMWVTEVPTKTSTVEYSTDGSHSFSKSIQGSTHTYTAGGWKGVIHEVHMPEFPANTRVTYHVGDRDGGWSAIYTVQTPPTVGNKRTADKPLRIATFGDMGTYIPLGYKVCEQMEEDHKKKPLDLIVHQGDIAYASTAVTADGTDDEDGSDTVGEEQEFVWDMWAQQVQPLAANIPYVAGVGNHEKFFNYSSYLARFKNPEPWGGSPSAIDNATFWFSFDFGLVHFTMMSTEHDYTPGSRQHRWIVDDLNAAVANRGTVPWIILVVDMYFCGHMHIYERIHAVNNGTVVNAASTIYRNPSAPVHVVQGNAGVFEDVEWVTPTPGWSAVRKSRIGYGRFEVYNATHLFYESLELATREAMDQFWIIKS